MPVTVTMRYWAGARAEAGTASEEFEADCVEDALTMACSAHAGLATILGRCSVLVEGRQMPPAQRSVALSGPTTVEVLPPFAGG